MGRYAMAYSDTQAYPQTVIQTPAKLGYISAYTKDSGATANPGFNALRAIIPGDYLVMVNTALAVDAADNFYISIYKNGIFTGYRNSKYINTNGNEIISINGIVELDANDLLELYINSGSDSIFEVTVQSSQFTMVAI